MLPCTDRKAAQEAMSALFMKCKQFYLSLKTEAAHLCCGIIRSNLHIAFTCGSSVFVNGTAEHRDGSTDVCGRNIYRKLAHGIFALCSFVHMTIKLLASETGIVHRVTGLSWFSFVLCCASCTEHLTAIQCIFLNNRKE